MLSLILLIPAETKKRGHHLEEYHLAPHQHYISKFIQSLLRPLEGALTIDVSTQVADAVELSIKQRLF